MAAIDAMERLANADWTAKDPSVDITELCDGYKRLHRLCEELDAEMDGVNVPQSAAAVLNAIRRHLNE